MHEELCRELIGFLGFSGEDEDNLVALAPIVDRMAAAIIDDVHRVLAKNATTAALIDGRGERLARTHRGWLMTLVAGEYGAWWCESQVRIGKIHVVMGISRMHVELTYALLRDRLIQMVHDHVADPDEAVSLTRSLVKALDLSLSLASSAFVERRDIAMSTDRAQGPAPAGLLAGHPAALDAS